MAYLNRCMFIGNVGKEPQIRVTSKGGNVASFSIAVSKRYRDNNGEQKEVTNWVNCTAFGKLSEVVKNLVTRGTQVYVEGEYNVSSYTDDSGNKKSVTCINVVTLQVLSGFKSREDDGDEEPGSGFANGVGFEDEDIPF